MNIIVNFVNLHGKINVVFNGSLDISITVTYNQLQ